MIFLNGTYTHEERFRADNKVRTTLVGIKLMDGSYYSREIYVAYGELQNPIAWHDLTGKYGDCALCPAKPLSREKKEKTIELVSHPKGMDDVDRVMELLV